MPHSAVVRVCVVQAIIICKIHFVPAEMVKRRQFYDNFKDINLTENTPFHCSLWTRMRKRHFCWGHSLSTFMFIPLLLHESIIVVFVITIIFSSRKSLPKPMPSAVGMVCLCLWFACSSIFTSDLLPHRNPLSPNAQNGKSAVIKYFYTIKAQFLKIALLALCLLNIIRR